MALMQSRSTAMPETSNSRTKLNGKTVQEAPAKRRFCLAIVPIRLYLQSNDVATFALDGATGKMTQVSKLTAPRAAVIDFAML